MSDNPYAATSPPQEPISVRGPIEGRQLLPLLRLITISFVLTSVIVTINALRTVAFLGTLPEWLASSQPLSEHIYVFYQTIDAISWPAIALYGNVRLWQFRSLLQEFVLGEIDWDRFAHAHIILWRAFVVQDICWVTFAALSMLMLPIFRYLNS